MATKQELSGDKGTHGVTWGQMGTHEDTRGRQATHGTHWET